MGNIGTGISSSSSERREIDIPAKKMPASAMPVPVKPYPEPLLQRGTEEGKRNNIILLKSPPLPKTSSALPVQPVDSSVAPSPIVPSPVGPVITSAPQTEVDLAQPSIQALTTAASAKIAKALQGLLTPDAPKELAMPAAVAVAVQAQGQPTTAIPPPVELPKAMPDIPSKATPVPMAGQTSQRAPSSELPSRGRTMDRDFVRPTSGRSVPLPTPTTGPFDNIDEAPSTMPSQCRAWSSFKGIGNISKGQWSPFRPTLGKGKGWGSGSGSSGASSGGHWGSGGWGSKGGPTWVMGRVASGYKIKVMDLPRYPQVNHQDIREKLEIGLLRQGFQWALVDLIDVNVTYTAESGSGCSLSVLKCH